MTDARILCGMAVMAIMALGGCDDALMAHRTPQPTDCMRRGGTWQVTDNGHAGQCHLPPGARVAGWTIVPRGH